MGLDPTRLRRLRAATGDDIGVIVRDGYIACQWGDIAAKFDWASATKPVVSTMLLFALAEQRIGSVDTRVSRFGWPMAAKDRTMTLRHLANMTSGYALPEAPGARWGYNDYAIALYCRTVFERIFAQDPSSATQAAKRLGALGLQDGRLFGSAREGFALTTSVRDYARIGWFWLNKGRWRDRSLLPEDYMDTYCRNQVPASLPRTVGGLNDYLRVGTHGGGTNQSSQAQGFYGFNWWLNTEGRAWPDAPHDTFQARGHQNAETLVVMPSLGIVAAWRGRRSGMGQPALDDANVYFGLLASAVR
ncbi:MAG: serine hydrolase domain-containing protein [Geminicoccaceae bacterium]